MARPAAYSYSDAGFNGFFRRTLTTVPTVTTLAAMGGGMRRQLNFDELQVSGSIGDTLQVGRVGIKGDEGHIYINNELGEEAGRIGDLRSLGEA